MATIGTAVTLRDIARVTDPDGKIAEVVEILNDVNEMLDDMLWKEGNLPTGDLAVIRSGLPITYWRLLNQGVPVSKSTTKQITHACGMLEAFAEVDKDLAAVNGNTAEFRLQEERPFMEAMSQELASTVIYGNSSVSPEEFNGLAQIYNTVSTGDEDDSSFNVIDGGGTGSDNTSIYLIGWSPNTIYGIYPKGSMMGLQMEDLGLETKVDSSNSGLYRVYRTHYQWKCGIVVKNWKFGVRICNIDVSNLVSGSGAVDLVSKMNEAEERIPSTQSVRLAWYVNRTVRTALRNQILAKNNVNLTFDNVGGKMVVSFNGIPVRRVDALLNTEAQVS